jgi:hypothetical protein
MTRHHTDNPIPTPSPSLAHPTVFLPDTTLLGPVPPSRALAAGEGGRRPGGGHFSIAHPAAATIFASLARSLPPSRAKPRGRVAGGRERGTSALPTRMYGLTRTIPTSRPSVACMPRRSAAKPREGGTSLSPSQQPQPSPRPLPAHSLSCVRSRGGGWPKAGRGALLYRPPNITASRTPCPLTPSLACMSRRSAAKPRGGGHFAPTSELTLPSLPRVLLPRGRVPEGREGGTSLSPTQQPQPSQSPCPLTPSLACMSRRSGAKPGEAAGEGARRAGGGHFSIAHPAAPTISASLARSLPPSLACRSEAAGGGH